MFPMIATLDDFRAAKKIFDTEAAALGVAGVPLGIMVEVPSVAVMDPDDGMTRPLAAPAAAATPDGPGPRGWAVSIEPTGPVPARPSPVVAVGLVAS